MITKEMLSFFIEDNKIIPQNREYITIYGDVEDFHDTNISENLINNSEFIKVKGPKWAPVGTHYIQYDPPFIGGETITLSLLQYKRDKKLRELGL